MERFEIADVGRRDALIATALSAFDADPVWRAASPDQTSRPRALRYLGGSIVDQALPYGTVRAESGFEEFSTFTVPEDDLPVTRMWRPGAQG